MNYQAEIQQKTQRLQALLSPFYQDDITVYPSRAEHYRLRAEFRIWHDDNGAHYVMTKPGEKANRQSIIYTPQLPQAVASINQLMPKLMNEITKYPALTHKLFQIEFLSTLSQDMLVTLIYHRQLDNEWKEAAHMLARSLDLNLIGRARKQKWVIGREYVEETFMIENQRYHYRQYEGGFSQPNGLISQRMIQWAVERSRNLVSNNSDLLELYCGNGNFTLPLAQNFRQVLATEISKTSVKALKENIAINSIDNIKVARLSAHEFYEAYQGTRIFRRLQQDDIHLSDYCFSTILVDPPRAGIDSDTLTMMQTFENLIYVSCNPQSLADNLEQLIHTHRVLDVAMFDQFPGTPHIETGVILGKKEI